MFTLHVLVMEDDDGVVRNLCEFFEYLSEGRSQKVRQDLMPEFLDTKFEVNVTVASTPCAAEVLLLRETGESFDIVVSDGTGWLGVATLAAKRFPVVGYTGSSECRECFQGVGIECYLKGCSNNRESRTPLGLAATALKIALKGSLARVGVTNPAGP